MHPQKKKEEKNPLLNGNGKQRNIHTFLKTHIVFVQIQAFILN